MRAALYSRVSSESQIENHSLESQLSTITAHAAAQGWTIAGHYSDPGYSGTTLERPGLTRLLGAARAGEFDVVLVYRLDRLARSPSLLYGLIEQFSQAKVVFSSATELGLNTLTPMGRVALGIGATFAEWERDTFIQRSRAGMLKAFELGFWTGGIVPYGYRVEERRLIPDEPAGEAVRLMFHLVTDGLSTVKISDHLTALGILPHYHSVGRGVRGKSTVIHWRPGGVLRILKNPVYKGLPEYGKRNARTGKPGTGITVGTSPALVTSDVWEAAQVALARNSLIAMRNAKHIYLLRSLVKCARCGCTYTGSRQSNRANPCYYYGCNGRTIRGGRAESQRCVNPFVRGDELDQTMRTKIRQRLNHPEAALVARDTEQPDVLAGQVSQAERAITAAQDQRTRLLDLYLSGDLERGVFIERQSGLDARLLALSATLEALRDTERQSAAAKDRARDLMALSAELRGQLDTMDDARWQRLAHTLVSRVLVGLKGEISVEWAL